MLVALSTGAVGIPTLEVLQLVFRSDGTVASEIVHRLRLPRAVAAFATGGLLALAGALMQVLLRNPLADPYILGLSGGAAAAALVAMMAGLNAVLINLSAFAGASLSVILVFAFARRELGRLHVATAADATPRLLLTGVVLAAGWSAIITLILTVAPEGRLRGMLFWLIGDLGGADSGALAIGGLVFALVVIYPFTRELNVMLQGQTIAHGLGVPVVRVRRQIYLVASLATALAVTAAGAIGFVGLIVPHALRLVIGNDQRVLLPASVLAGGSLLLLADTAARTMIAPQQLPVGVVTALIGVPMFLYLLMRNGTSR